LNRGRKKGINESIDESIIHRDDDNNDNHDDNDDGDRNNHSHTSACKTISAKGFRVAGVSSAFTCVVRKS